MKLRDLFQNKNTYIITYDQKKYYTMMYYDDFLSRQTI